MVNNSIKVHFKIILIYKFPFKKARLIFIFVLIIGAIFISPTKADTSTPIPTERYCGSKMRSAMKFFCQPQIKSMVRSGYFGPFQREMTRESRSIDENVTDKYIVRSEGSMITACCKIGCSLSTLVSFCPN